MLLRPSSTSKSRAKNQLIWDQLILSRCKVTKKNRHKGNKCKKNTLFCNFSCVIGKKCVILHPKLHAHEVKVIIDAHIPYLKGSLEPYASVVYLEPSEITASTVRDADCVIVRTRTRADACLLEGSHVKLVLTATIGYDHINTAYCLDHGIEWHNCPGCNAGGVCDYVESALQQLGLFAKKRTIGIVGVGHVGSLVEQMAASRGWDVVVCDPLRAKHEQATSCGNRFMAIEAVAAVADVITFHTPLTFTGSYPTYHLCNADLLRACKPDALIINSARGGIVDEVALLSSGHAAVIDCWENEPLISQEVLRHAAIATMHIAGYTRLGKYKASEMVLAHFNRFFHTDARMVEAMRFPEHQLFDIESVSRSLKAQPERFEQLREAYVLR